MLDADIGTQPHDGVDADHRLVDGEGCVAIKVGGSIDIRFQSEIGKAEVRRQYSDDAHRLAINRDGAADDCSVGVEVGAPKMTAYNNDRRAPRPVFVFGKEAPKLRNDSEHGEEVCSHVGAADT